MQLRVNILLSLVYLLLAEEEDQVCREEGSWCAESNTAGLGLLQQRLVEGRSSAQEESRGGSDPLPTPGTYQRIPEELPHILQPVRQWTVELPQGTKLVLKSPKDSDGPVSLVQGMADYKRGEAESSPFVVKGLSDWVLPVPPDAELLLPATGSWADDTTQTTTTSLPAADECLQSDGLNWPVLGISLGCDTPHTDTNTCPAKRSCKEIKDDPACSSWRNGMYKVTAGGNEVEVCCKMEDDKGWTLIYKRENYALSTDHMQNIVPSDGKAAGVNAQINSKSWFIPEGLTKWRWQVSKCNGPWAWIETDIPSEAFKSGSAANANNVAITGVQVGGDMDYGSGTLYYQRSNNWNGIGRATSGAGDTYPNAIQSRRDSCKFGEGMDTTCVGDDDCMTSTTNMIEQYISNWKNVAGGNGHGGATCDSIKNIRGVKFEFWAY